MVRQIVPGAELALAKLVYQNRFPYVSHSFPFGAKGAKHVGPIKKCLIENRQHELTMREEHGYCGD